MSVRTIQRGNSITGTRAVNPNHNTKTRRAMRNRGTPWTVEEHAKFLDGLKELGKGNWRGISRHFVPSRTPTQVASHAQKYFIRISRGDDGQRKRRRESIFDSCSSDESPPPTPPPSPPRKKQHHVEVDAQTLWWWSYWTYVQVTRDLHIRATVPRPTPIRGRPVFTQM